MSQTIEKPRVGGPGTGLGPSWNVIVVNDNHNTFEGVAAALARHVPGVDLNGGYAIAERIHRAGLAIVWTGHKELAEHYWELLRDEGLTMAPLESA
ncbi:MAG: ATP-dependent Clp protease adaptor ClpS [Solirubrobacterales bacterium]|nr:ATP-dependent Clp protease adaptor ClpS [Solirubrobacterales bacterium]